ncbi:MAG: hypothetical protein ACLPWF_19315 [Bryobacteraceae bacterium]
MSTRSLLMVGAMTIASLNIASAKSYDIVLNAPAKAGTTELKPGEYKVKIEGSQAVFTNVQSNISVSVPAQVENAQKKFPYTSLETTSQDGMDNIQAIDLADSNTRVTLHR